MKIKKIASCIAGVAFLAVASVHVHGFVDGEFSTAFVEDTSVFEQKIEEIGADLESKDTIEKINEAIAELDEVLDEQPANEEEVLTLRDAFVELRFKAMDGARHDDKELVQIVDVVSPAPMPAISFAPAPVSTGYVVSGGGAVSGGGGFAAGINWRRILLIGGLVGGLASIDDDDDVEVASVGMAAN